MINITMRGRRLLVAKNRRVGDPDRCGWGYARMLNVRCVFAGPVYVSWVKR